MAFTSFKSVTGMIAGIYLRFKAVGQIVFLIFSEHCCMWLMIKHVSGLRLYFPKRKKQQKQKLPTVLKTFCISLTTLMELKMPFFLPLEIKEIMFNPAFCFGLGCLYRNCSIKMETELK